MSRKPRQRSQSVGARAWRRFRRSKLAMMGTALIGLLVVLALFAPLIAPFHPTRDEDLNRADQPPSRTFLLGTDMQGRDVLSRVIHGARVSLLIGVAATAISLGIGLVLGSLSGYFGGWVDHLIMRFTDMVLAFPAPLFVIAAAAVFEQRSMPVLFWILGLIGWPGIARVVRSKVIEVRATEYADAARALGAGHTRIIARHILPNSLAPIIVAASIGVAGNILTESWLSFLGLGLSPDTPSWGNMIHEGQQVLSTMPWLSVFPGLAIIFAVLGFNLLGDGLRDALDPRLKDAG
ncbi:MAG: ABC transporter permease [Verrucomicrobia bacterium]|nr:ABC transporter permease [Verrucomicrobiota bacterium]